MCGRYPDDDSQGHVREELQQHEQLDTQQGASCVPGHFRRGEQEYARVTANTMRRGHDSTHCIPRLPLKDIGMACPVETRRSPSGLALWIGGSEL